MDSPCTLLETFSRLEKTRFCAESSMKAETSPEKTQKRPCVRQNHCIPSILRSFQAHSQGLSSGKLEEWKFFTVSILSRRPSDPVRASSTMSASPASVGTRGSDGSRDSCPPPGTPHPPRPATHLPTPPAPAPDNAAAQISPQ